MAKQQTNPAQRKGGYKVGFISTTTLGTTGNRSVTGVGFKPKMVKFNVLKSSGTGAIWTGYGTMDEAGTQWTQSGARYGGGGANEQSYFSKSNCISSLNFSPTPELLAAFTSMDTDGFTINVSTASSTYEVAYEAYG